ncbi:ankyrin repeat-containing domain, PGG domain, Gag-polypeptide of LTR copia-type [Artemisia annua]|uniref:Ankyrin repeat-containing domain, PGG domain, Gag-polypeptide of LTR copia-type n=1 Tax=Artemisia annua TaxID=35608 RepID=A0A2U1N8F6_ARTAN|nr:ankyrin repeat-containing domain, PGG domain, Gag-polypeptide of LTR copia-type [Artemisia annua]
MSSSSTTITSTPSPPPYPSTVNIANFISVKLTGHENYHIWKTQFLCLIEAHDLLSFINDDMVQDSHAWRRTDVLLRGWILCSVSEEVLGSIITLKTAKDVWDCLEGMYDNTSCPLILESGGVKEEMKVKGGRGLMRSAPIRGVSQQIDLKGDSVTPGSGEFKMRKLSGFAESFSSESDDCRHEPPANVSAYLPLYKAALRGDWDDAQYIIDRDEEAITANINKYGFTALHIVVGTGKQGITFVEKLVEKISPISLLEMLTSSEKYTPLHIAAVVGNTAAVEILVNRNPMLLYAEDVDGLLPIHRALINSHRETFLYLLDVTKDNQFPSAFTGNMGVTLLSNVIFAGYFDTALDLCTRYPELATTKPSDNVDAPLMAIARKADAFESGCRLNFIDRLIYKYVPLKWENLDSNRKHGKMNFHSSDLQKTSLVIWKFLGKIVPRITHIQKMKVVHHQAVALVKLLCQEISALNLQSNSIHYANPIIEAASNGAYEVVQEIADAFPQAIWYSDINSHFLIQLAIIHRCETVYNLTYQMSDHKHFHKTLKDHDNNNLLHLAGKLAPPHKLNLVSGAALQMQRELQWFKEVEAFVHPKYRTEKNIYGETPKMLFGKAHKKLVKAGEEWMKKTADSYTVTAGLITTIVFAAAITVPGGNNGDTGHPIYAKELSFLIFAVADAISLFTSTTSLLLFLSILTARYAEEDFLFTLPSRLIMGLSTLFVSTCSMMIAFAASLYLLFGQGKEWILIPIAALSCLPITCFVTLQFPLLVELISCTYGRGLFGKQSNRPFY